MNIGLKFRDQMFGSLGVTLREELDQLVASIVQHWLVGHCIDGSHSNAIGSGAGSPTGFRYLRDDMTWDLTPFVSADSGATITGAWTFSTLPILSTLNGYIKGTAGALSAVTTIPGSDVTLANEQVTNAMLSHMASQTIKMRATGSTGDPEDKKISDLAEQVSPSSGDYILVESAGNLRKVDWANLPTGGIGTGTAGPAGPTGPPGVPGLDGDPGRDGRDGSPGRSVRVFEQSSTPTGAYPGDIWITP